MIKCEIIVDGYLYGITNDLKNWDDVMVSIKRGNYDGVVRSFSSKFEFVNSAYAILKKQFRDKYLGAAATIVISRRNNSWMWNELFRCSLDFSTYEDDGRTLSINAIDDSLASLIKAKRGTKYEYSMDVIKDDKKLWYNRIEISNSANYNVYDKDYDNTHSKDPENDEVIISTNQSGYYVLPLSPSESSEIYSRESAEVLDNADPNNHGGIIRFTGTKSVRVSMKFHVRKDSSAAFAIRLVIIQGSTQTVVDKFYNGNGNEFDVDYSYDIPSFYLSSGYILKIDFPGGGYKSWIAISKFDHFRVKYTSIGTPVYLDVASPSKLLSRLLQSMNGGNDGLVGEINFNNSMDRERCLLLAADSIRGMPNAKLYSSFNQFAEWMSAVFGFAYEVSGNKVVFKHRTLFFSSDIVKSIANYDEFSYTVNPSIIYSRVRVGYEKQEYDSINGRDEFRFTTTYSTGVSLTDNSLDLISPYRADAYGVEFLVQKRGEDTTDSSSDNDVFFCGAELSFNGDRYELIRNGFNLSGVISSSTMFNAMYSPRSMIVANSAFIGACTGLLTYTSGEGNTDVSVNGINEKDDLVIPESDRLFTVGEVSFVTPEYDLPESCLGTVELNGANETYYGYMMKAEMSIGREECTKYSLMVKKIIN